MQQSAFLELGIQGRVEFSKKEKFKGATDSSEKKFGLGVGISRERRIPITKWPGQDKHTPTITRSEGESILPPNKARNDLLWAKDDLNDWDEAESERGPNSPGFVQSGERKFQTATEKHRKNS